MKRYSYTRRSDMFWLYGLQTWFWGIPLLFMAALVVGLVTSTAFRLIIATVLIGGYIGLLMSNRRGLNRWDSWVESCINLLIGIFAAVVYSSVWIPIVLFFAVKYAGIFLGGILQGGLIVGVVIVDGAIKFFQYLAKKLYELMHWLPPLPVPFLTTGLCGQRFRFHTRVSQTHESPIYRKREIYLGDELGWQKYGLSGVEYGTLQIRTRDISLSSLRIELASPTDIQPIVTFGATREIVIQAGDRLTIDYYLDKKRELKFTDLRPKAIPQRHYHAPTAASIEQAEKQVADIRYAEQQKLKPQSVISISELKALPLGRKFALLALIHDASPLVTTTDDTLPMVYGEVEYKKPHDKSYGLHGYTSLEQLSVTLAEGETVFKVFDSKLRPQVQGRKRSKQSGFYGYRRGWHTKPKVFRTGGIYVGDDVEITGYRARNGALTITGLRGMTEHSWHDGNLLKNFKKEKVEPFWDDFPRRWGRNRWGVGGRG